MRGLALVYCLALAEASWVRRSGEARSDSAKSWMQVILRWVTRLPDESVWRVLLDDDVAELTWSCMLAVSYTGGNADLLRDAAKEMLGRSEIPRELSPLDEYSLRFLTGLGLAADLAEQELEDLVDRFRDDDDFGSLSDDLHIDPIGRVPSANRNQVVTFDPEVITAINEWTVSSFPRFLE
jgi:hypothetical protein